MKRRLNVKFLACLLAVVVLLVPSVHFLHAYQIKRNAGTFRDKATEAEKLGRETKNETERQIHFAKAVDYFTRYLSLAPKDIDVRAQYALLLADEKLVRSARQLGRAFMVLEDVLRRDSQGNDHHLDAAKRDEIHVVAAQIALVLRRFGDAQRHVEELLKSSPDDGKLEQIMGRALEGQGKYDKARDWFEKSVDHAPGEIGNYEHLAYLLRHRTDQVIRDKEKKDDIYQRADKLMDEMVAANRDSYAAYLARARYRGTTLAAGQRMSKEIVDDVDQARRLAPEEPLVLLFSAEVAQDQGDVGRARGFLRLGREAHPDDWRMYRALAQLEQKQGRAEEARYCLQDGVKKLPRNLDLLWDLAGLLIQQHEMKEAADVIARLRKEAISPAQLDYLSALLLVDEEKWRDAAQLLEVSYSHLVAQGDRADGWLAADLARSAGFVLGRCYEQLGDTDRANAAYSRMAAREPRLVSARLSLAASHWAMGRLNEALDEYRQVLRLPDAPPAIWVNVAQLLFLRTLDMPKEQQDWTPRAKSRRREPSWCGHFCSPVSCPSCRLGRKL
jgi:tetratricopeptide (TPR) repeat protein